MRNYWECNNVLVAPPMTERGGVGTVCMDDRTLPVLIILLVVLMHAVQLLYSAKSRIFLHRGNSHRDKFSENLHAFSFDYRPDLYPCWVCDEDGFNEPTLIERELRFGNGVHAPESGDVSNFHPDTHLS